MKKLLYIAGLTLALGQMTPVQAAAVYAEPLPTGDEATEAQHLGLEFLRTSSEMWFLLSGIGSRSDADAAAVRFLELVKLTFELDNRLSSLPLVAADAECVGMMDNVQMRILETLDDLHVEFVSICRANCYDSDALRKAFEEAVQLGMFAQDDMELMHHSAAPLTEEEASVEIARIRQLVAPDRAVLDILVAVQDETSASAAAPELQKLSQQLRMLLPEIKRERREFAPASVVVAREALAPIEPILWSIRSEIVRIAALPGYEAETFDVFSDALDSVFESLGATHCVLFDSVFDASFRADLECALRENNLSSQ
ncbi:MAG: hypothetical protein IKY92_04900 [Akkermansia sp.]|nr:hypothetical protein [Akkermansia sp.]